MRGKITLQELEIGDGDNNGECGDGDECEVVVIFGINKD